MEQYLRKARRNENTKWIILGVHRAFYSSDQCEYSAVTPLAHALEELVNEYKVDIVTKLNSIILKGQFKMSPNLCIPLKALHVDSLWKTVSLEKLKSAILEVPFLKLSSPTKYLPF